MSKFYTPDSFVSETTAPPTQNTGEKSDARKIVEWGIPTGMAAAYGLEKASKAIASSGTNAWKNLKDPLQIAFKEAKAAKNVEEAVRLADMISKKKTFEKSAQLAAKAAMKKGLLSKALTGIGTKILPKVLPTLATTVPFLASAAGIGLAAELGIEGINYVGNKLLDKQNTNLIQQGRNLTEQRNAMVKANRIEQITNELNRRKLLRAQDPNFQMPIAGLKGE